MCGIAGVSLRAGMRVDEELLRKLAAALAHRGPDGEGYFSHGGLGLAHRRLSIIDVDGGKQPLVSKAAPVALVGNGEIYNYKTLQKGVKATLQTGSDCEPPLHMYVQSGDDVWMELEGMYALAIADGRDGTLHLGTDPFGIKPLYYVETTVGFAFASEPRALVQAGWVRAEVNHGVLGGLLNRHYSTGRETLFKNVFRMLPGERLVVKDGVVVSRGRQLPDLQGARSEADGDSVADFGQRLQDAVERHLQADVPYGLLLSGGLDSSALAVAMRDLGAPLHAYTAKIEVDGGPNEATAAEALAKKLGATHTTVTYGRADFWPALADMAWAMDDLMTDYAALPLLKLTKRAREDVKILLSGEGGDEMLGGYSNYRKKRGLLWHWKARRSGDAWPFRAHFATKALVRVPEPAVQAWEVDGFTDLQARQGGDVAGWLPSDLLLKLDRTTMHNGIEGRVPFLDDQFAPYAFALPDSLKVHQQGGHDYGKYILRQHLDAKGLGEMAWARKQGFSVAVGTFMAEKPKLLATLWGESDLLKTILRPGATDLLGRLGHAKSANLVFSLTLLALWEKLHVEGVGREELAARLGGNS